MQYLYIYYVIYMIYFNFWTHKKQVSVNLYQIEETVRGHAAPRPGQVGQLYGRNLPRPEVVLRPPEQRPSGIIASPKTCAHFTCRFSSQRRLGKC